MPDKKIGDLGSQADEPSEVAGDVNVPHPPLDWIADSVSIAPRVRYNRRYKPEVGEAFSGVLVDRGEEEDPYSNETHRVVVVETVDRVRHGVRLLADLRSLWRIANGTPVFIRPLRKRPLGGEGKFAWEFDLRVPTGTKLQTEKGPE